MDSYLVGVTDEYLGLSKKRPCVIEECEPRHYARLQAQPKLEGVFSDQQSVRKRSFSDAAELTDRPPRREVPY
jgi:hypothetical protein